MKVYSPNKDYTGVSASVPFCGGVGETDDPYLLDWFRKHGYTVEEVTGVKAPENEDEPTNMEKSEEPEEPKASKEPSKKSPSKKAGE